MYRDVAMWHQKFLRQFAAVPQNPSESEFQGPYNKLLSFLFPVDSDFTVVPRYMPDSRVAADFIVMFEVYFGNKPVLILELKPPGHLCFPSTRQSADAQIRRRINDLAGG